MYETPQQILSDPELIDRIVKRESLTKTELQAILKGRNGNTKIFFGNIPVTKAFIDGNKIVLG